MLMEINARYLAEMDPQYDVIVSTDARDLAAQLNDAAAEGFVPVVMNSLLSGGRGYQTVVYTVVVLVRPKEVARAIASMRDTQHTSEGNVDG